MPELPKRSVTTLSIRVSSGQWQRVVSGAATEFRGAANGYTLNSVPLPTPAVIFRRRREGDSDDERLVLLLDKRVEALGAITDEGLVAAGFSGDRDTAFARFRRDWMLQERKRFEPLREVVVYTVAPLEEMHLPEAGLALVRHLYAPWLPTS